MAMPVTPILLNRLNPCPIHTSDTIATVATTAIAKYKATTASSFSLLHPFLELGAMPAVASHPLLYYPPFLIHLHV